MVQVFLNLKTFNDIQIRVCKPILYVFKNQELNYIQIERV